MKEEICRKLDGLPKIDYNLARDFELLHETIFIKVTEILVEEYGDSYAFENYPENFINQNQQNFAKLLINCFYTNELKLMLPYLAWYYRAYCFRGFASDYFMAELKAWIKAIQTFIDPSKAKPMIIFLQWLLDHQAKLFRMAKSQTLPIFNISYNWKRVETSFFSAIMQGDYDRCLELASKSVTNERQLQEFYTNVIVPVMYKVGYYWEMNQITIIHEQHATQIVFKVREYLFNKYVKPLPQTRGRAFLTTVSQPAHELGLKMVGDFLQLEGWKVEFVNKNTTFKNPANILKLVEKARPDLVGISISLPFEIIDVRYLVNEIRKSSKLKDSFILLGGNLFQDYPALRISSLTGVDDQAAKVEKAAEKANKWWQTISARTEWKNKRNESPSSDASHKSKKDMN